MQALPDAEDRYETEQLKMPGPFLRKLNHLNVVALDTNGYRSLYWLDGNEQVPVTVPSH
jgi:hypothetical protein